MKYFLVFQNKTFDQERAGGFLWSPQRAESGFNVHHWSRMKEIAPGDLIFSVVKQNIVAISLALTYATDTEKPAQFQAGNTWGREGYLVEAEYNDLKSPFSIRENTREILPLMQQKYAPFTSEGKGNQGYLYSVTDEFADYLLKNIQKENNMDFLAKNEVKSSHKEMEDIKELDDILDKTLNETTKEQLVQTRIGQGLFREKLFTRSKSCEICGIDFRPLLRASHIKPWANSNHNERLDINNGLLLCTEHDVLFDQGYITFKQNQMTIASELPNSIRKRLSSFSKIDFEFKSQQAVYLEWHVENIFKDSKE